jgi:hypothetical protein
MKEYFIESENQSFISGWFIDQKICDDVIDFCNTDNYFPVKPGLISTNGGEVDTSVKHSFDKVVSPYTKDERLVNYFNSLSEVIKFYREKYVFCNMTQSWSVVEHVNIQYYPPNGGYKVFHFERNGQLSSMNRHLTFMTYLNDVYDSGETEFYYQNLRVKPQKGLTLVWPVDWTHTHRGIPSPTEEKIIITGWYSFT